MSIDRNSAVQMFSNGLDALFSNDEKSGLYLYWMIKDFPDYSNDFVAEVFQRIRQRKFIPEKNEYQPIIPVFMFISLLISLGDINCMKTVFNLLPEAYRAAFGSNIPYVPERVNEIFNKLFNDNKLPNDVVNEIINTIEIYRADPSYYKPSIPVEEVVQEETRSCRSTMVSASQWESGGINDLTQTIDPSLDDSQESSVLIKNGPIPKCAFCQGDFETKPSQNGTLILGAVHISGTGYVHVKCKAKFMKDVFH